MVSESLSNAQIELLKLFSREIPEQELIDLKRVLVRYLAQRAVHAANKVWDEKGWSDADMNSLLHAHERTPYQTL